MQTAWNRRAKSGQNRYNLEGDIAQIHARTITISLWKSLRAVQTGRSSSLYSCVISPFRYRDTVRFTIAVAFVDDESPSRAALMWQFLVNTHTYTLSFSFALQKTQRDVKMSKSRERSFACSIRLGDSTRRDFDARTCDISPSVSDISCNGYDYVNGNTLDHDWETYEKPNDVEKEEGITRE